MNLLASICKSNTDYALKISKKQITTYEAKPVSGRIILSEICECLEKDYFAPFEREDIFILSKKLYELSENTFLFCNTANEMSSFSKNNTVSEKLQSMSDTNAVIFSNLCKYPKQGDMKPFSGKIYTDYISIKKYIYQHSEKQFNPFLRQTEICADNYNDIITKLQYILIKNS